MIEFMIVAGALCIWSMYCNNKTMYERKQIIRLVYKHPEWVLLSRQMDEVSYGKHHLWKVLLYDPMTLYSPRIQALVYADNVAKRGKHP